MKSSVLPVLFFIGFSLLIPAKGILAADLLIVQVQIAGEKSSYDSIKIYNQTVSDIYLGNFTDSYVRLVKRAKTSVKDYTIKSWSKDSEAKIPAKGYYIWASNKDGYDTIVGANVSTSQIISKDNGIALRAGPENTGEIIDAVGWGTFNNVLFEGTSYLENPGQDQKLERKQTSGNYQDINNNSQDFYLNPPSDTETMAEVPQKQQTAETSEAENKELSTEPILPKPTESKPVTNPGPFPSGVFINEILPSPTGPDETEEWIEIYNSNNSEVDISGWQIQDAKGKIKSYSFPAGTKISPQGFLVLSRPTTKVTLNNDGDGLNLIQPDGKIIDTVSFEKAPQGQSYNKTGDGWIWSDNLTPGSVNTIPSQESDSEEEEIEGIVGSPGKELESNKKGLAAIGQQFSASPRSLAILLFALFVALISALLILFLKKKIKTD